MHRFLPGLFALAVLVSPLSGTAAEGGTASGTVVIDGETVRLSHAYAYVHQLGPRDTELRIALVDRAIPADSIAGARPLPIERLTMENRVRGLLLRYDPEERRDSSVVTLDARTIVQEALAPRPIPRRAKMLEYFRVESTRVRGEVDGRFDTTLQIRNVRFSAPLSNTR